MTIARLTGTSTAEWNFETSKAATWPGSITANSLAVLSVTAYTGGGITISTPSGFTSQLNQTYNNNTLAIFTKECAGSESGTFNVVLSAASYGAFVFDVYDASGDVTFTSASTADTGTSSDATAPSVSGTSGQMLLLAYGLSDPPGTTNSNPSGATIAQSSAFTTNSLRSYYEALASTGATGSKTWDFTNSRDWLGTAMLLSEAGGGGSPTTTVVTGSATAITGLAQTYTFKLDADPGGATVNVTPSFDLAHSWSSSPLALNTSNWNTGLTSNLTATAGGSGTVTSTNDGGLANDTLAVTVASVSRPSAVIAGSWTDEVGGTLVVADINDASDSTGAMDPAGASYPVLAFTATTPLTATSQTFYFRGRDIAAGKQARQVIYASDGTTVVATGAWKTMTGSLATYSDVLTPTATAYKGQIQTQALPTTPSHYSSATSGEWYALPNSSLTSSGVGWAGTDPGGTSDYQATVTAWGGATLNTVGCYYSAAFHAGTFLIVFGGGHGDYAGNEVYAYGPLEDESPAWRRLTDPTVPGVENTARDGSSNPVSRHTYDTLTYDAAANRMLCLGAPGYYSLGNAYNACDAFDFDTNTWSALADLTTGGGGTGSVSACTVIDGTYAWVWPMGNGQYLNRIALSGDARTTYAKNFPTTRYGAKAGYDPVHEIMAWCSGSTVYAFDLRNPGSNVEYSPTTSGTAPTTGAPMAWDNANACFKVWADSGKTLFTLTPGANPYSGGDTWVWTSTTPAGGATPAAETTNGTHGRFQYNNSGDVIGALVMPNQTSSIYMFKP